MGTPYVYGGSTPAGFDCSGFTQYVFAKAGKSLPRVTTAQQAMATPVSDPQPGDLVFFGSPAYHMGIYLGDGMMIDSPRTGSSVSIRPVFDGVSGYGRV
ncbi:C40 family peptidase [Janibacter limosus]|uniref:C40 family peptidase n=1 Tax=Janibacter limosus TaxID=53458 RepID=A0AC61U8G6_9MICO|nr:C40 family peptidase [Janibacter limosus]UUZ46234.1 C40 family peptidase [Janibacter limosus]